MKKIIKPLIIGAALTLGLTGTIPTQAAAEGKKFNNYSINNGIFMMDGDSNGTYEYRLKTKLNPLINKQINGALSAVKDDTRFYSDLVYTRPYLGSPSITHITVAEGMVGSVSGAYAFSYRFYDDLTFEKGNFLSLRLVGLLYKNINPVPSDYAETRYKEALKNSLNGIFGANGTSIYHYVMKKHVDSINGEIAKNASETVNFGNYKIKFKMDGWIPEFHFFYNALPDLTPPTAPKINSVKYGAKTISGKTEASIKVQTQVGNKIYTAVSNSKGNFTIKVPTLYSGSITVHSIDKAGNKSLGTKVKIKK